MARKTQKDQGNSEKGAEKPQFESEDAKFGFFDSSKLGRELGKATPASVLLTLDKMSVAELLDLRTELDKLLPARRLSDMDLEEEVLFQFARTKELYSDISADSNTPANQRAQVANSCTTILDQIIKMQTRLYRAERVKAMETALIRTLKEAAPELQARFFELYERNLEGMAVDQEKK
jgi:hypothetical protein